MLDLVFLMGQDEYTTGCSTEKKTTSDEPTTITVFQCLANMGSGIEMKYEVLIQDIVNDVDGQLYFVLLRFKNRG